jgi:glycine/D-amino acid oxidase-like deaminating enzyme
MDLRSGQAFWPIKNGLLGVYPPLEQDLICEVAVIGGGITGALVAHYLVSVGIDTVVLDKRDIAKGSTSASTALLQYEIDTHLVDLMGMVGEADAARAYRLCYQAIDQLEGLVCGLGEHCSFQRKTSLYLASRPRDVRVLEAEARARRRIGLEVEFWPGGEVLERTGFSRPAALFSRQTAEMDPYRFTHQLLAEGQRKGLRVYDRTEVRGWEYRGEEVVLQTNRESTVRARRMVFAAGYESQQYLKQPLARLKNTYALVSEPLPVDLGWLEQTLIWETARPYLYLRATQDRRVMVGGEDDPYLTLESRERRIPRKQRRLEQRFAEIFPAIPLETAFSWGGTFGETKDGLAYIGESPEIPRAYFVLGYGGNGITYSVVGAQIVRDLYLGRENPDRQVFRFER